MSRDRIFLTVLIGVTGWFIGEAMNTAYELGKKSCEAEFEAQFTSAEDTPSDPEYKQKDEPKPTAPNSNLSDDGELED